MGLLAEKRLVGSLKKHVTVGPNISRALVKHDLISKKNLIFVPNTHTSLGGDIARRKIGRIIVRFELNDCPREWAIEKAESENPSDEE
jgi:hypothetical protein